MSKISTPGLIILGIALIAGSAYWFWLDDIKPRLADNDKIVCIQDAKLCPDGSKVGRTGPSCEFASCPPPPVDPSKIKVDDHQDDISYLPSSISGWKKYKNGKYGFEFDLPEEWSVKDATGGLLSKGSTEKFYTASPVPYDHIFAVLIKTKSVEELIQPYKNNLNADLNQKILGIENIEKFGHHTVRLRLQNITTGQKFSEYFVRPFGHNWTFIIIGEGDVTHPYHDVGNEIVNTFKFVEPIDTSTWKTYRNEKYGFEVKYPREWGEVKFQAFDRLSGSCIAQGIVIRGSFTNKKLNYFCSESLDYKPCGDRGGSVCDIKNFTIENGQIADNSGGKYDILKSVKTSSAGIEGYIFVDPYGDIVGIIKFTHGELGTISFGSYEDVLILEQILSTFKFLK
ncbi:MAG: hypothetical protein HYT98_02380 [Candidatus Sungbacteria bacterium]|nr:hypothetical protein [Candidatus Sungbacteria bacterium]